MVPGRDIGTASCGMRREARKVRIRKSMLHDNADNL